MCGVITSTSNPHIKHANRLLSSSRFRKENREFIIEGVRLCDEALRCSVQVKHAFVLESLYKKYESVTDNLFILSENVMKHVTETQNSQGVAFVCGMDGFASNKRFDEKVLILEDIRDPSNLGAICRSCDAFDVKDLVVSKNSCDIYNPKVLRASMGSVFRLNVLETDNIREFIEKLNSEGFETCAMVVDRGVQSILDLKIKSKKALVIGNESNGLKPATVHVCSKKVTIPMRGETESLNAAVAASIAVWELFS